MKVLVICSHGGHLTELLELLEAFEGYDLTFVTYHSSRDPEVRSRGRAYFLRNIGKNPVRMGLAFLSALYIILRERPRVIVSTGSEIAIPFFWVGKLLRRRNIFIETCARVTNPSFTGRMVYPVSDLFLVQWEKLLDSYGPGARYRGSVL